MVLHGGSIGNVNVRVCDHAAISLNLSEASEEKSMYIYVM